MIESNERGARMKIRSIGLRGFTGIKKGLGVDEIRLDLSGVGGLVALDGPNGRGKTTLLENMQPFRTLPSRKKALQYHAFLKDSFRDLIFDFEGDEYRTLLKIDGEAGKQEGFIWKNGRPETSGKVVDYDRYMIGLLGSPELFFNSVFCAQGSEKISDMTTGRLKALFSEFLRLERYVAWEDTAKQCGVVLGAEVTHNEIARASVAAVAGDGEAVEMEIKEIGAAIEKGAGDIVALRVKLAEAEDRLKAANDVAAENGILRERLANYRKALDDLEKKMRADESRVHGELGSLKAEVERIRAEIVKYVALMAQKGEIAAAFAARLRYSAKIEEVGLHIERIRSESGATMTVLAEFKGRHTTLLTEIERLKLDSAGAGILSEIKGLHIQAALLEKRAEDPGCPAHDAICGFVASAAEAAAELPEKIEGLDSHRRKIRDTKEKAERSAGELLIAISERQNEISNQSEALEKLGKELKDVKMSLAAVEPVAARAGEVAVAEGRLSDLEKAKKEVEARGLVLRDNWENGVIREHKSIDDFRKLIADTGAAIQDEIEGKVKNLESSIKNHKMEIEKISENLSKMLQKMSVLEHKRGEIEKAAAEVTRLDERVRKVRRELSEWQYIKVACGKDGLRALEIDAVAPTITADANRLLSEAFGPLFTVRFQTVDPGGREVLDILVIRDDGMEVPLDNLSGGEKVWNLKALRLALAMISKKKGGKNILTAMADEEDGALDSENARNFVLLYRAFMGSGGFDDCFFITHKPECVAMADRVIRFNRGGVGIE